MPKERTSHAFDGVHQLYAPRSANGYESIVSRDGGKFSKAATFLPSIIKERLKTRSSKRPASSQPKELLALGFSLGTERDIVRLTGLVRILKPDVSVVAVGAGSSTLVYEPIRPPRSSPAPSPVAASKAQSGKGSLTGSSSAAAVVITPPKAVGASSSNSNSSSSSTKSASINDSDSNGSQPKLLSDYPFAYKEHNFKTWRGLQPCVTPHTCGILLDYYWLQCAYYRQQYGIDWLSTKAPAAFHRCPRLRFMILPYDKDSTDLITQVMEGGAAALKAAGLEMANMSDKDAKSLHPLVLATAQVAKKSKEQRDEARTQEARYWRSPEPFLVIYRAGSDWRADLAKLFVKAPA